MTCDMRPKLEIHPRFPDALPSGSRGARWTLAPHPRCGEHFDLLLVDELGHAHSGRGLGRQVAEQLTVVGDVLR